MVAENKLVSRKKISQKFIRRDNSFENDSRNIAVTMPAQTDRNASIQMMSRALDKLQGLRAYDSILSPKGNKLPKLSHIVSPKGMSKSKKNSPRGTKRRLNPLTTRKGVIIYRNEANAII